MGTMQIKVAGLSFRPGYPANILHLSDVYEAGEVDAVKEGGPRDWSTITTSGRARGPQVLLVPNPENEHDPNAVEVHVPALGRRQFVGFVPAKDGTNVPVARRLAAGEFYEAYVSAVPINPKYVDRPGLEIEVKFHRSECSLTDPVLREDGAHCTCLDMTPEWTT